MAGFGNVVGEVVNLEDVGCVEDGGEEKGGVEERHWSQSH